MLGSRVFRLYVSLEGESNIYGSVRVDYRLSFLEGVKEVLRGRRLVGIWIKGLGGEFRVFCGCEYLRGLFMIRVSGVWSKMCLVGYEFFKRISV